MVWNNLAALNVFRNHELIWLILKMHLLLLSFRIWWPKCEPCLLRPRPSSLPLPEEGRSFFWYPLQPPLVRQRYSPISWRFILLSSVFISDVFIYDLLFQLCLLCRLCLATECPLQCRKNEASWSRKCLVSHLTGGGGSFAGRLRHSWYVLVQRESIVEVIHVLCILFYDKPVKWCQSFLQRYVELWQM